MARKTSFAIRARDVQFPLTRRSSIFLAETPLPFAGDRHEAAAAGSRAYIHTDVLLGSERLSAVKTGVHQQPLFSGEAGLLGNGLLSQFRVTVDAGKSRLLLDRIR